jgi:hypothetical protein
MTTLDTPSDNFSVKVFQANFSHNYPYLGGYLVLAILFAYNLGLASIGPIVMFGLGCYAIILPKNNSFEVGKQALVMRNPLRFFKKTQMTYAYEAVEKMEIFTHKNARTRAYFLRIYLRDGSKKAHTITLLDWAKPLAEALEAQGVIVEQKFW